MKKKIKKIKKTKKASPKNKKAVAKKKTPAPKASKPIGKVTHFYNHIRVAIVKFNAKVKTGTSLHFKGATTDFVEAAKSMQFDHEPIVTAPKGKQIGIKLKKRVREGDLVYKD